MSFEYRRKINYYETDKMGVVHHSNYIRFLEEARCVWLEQLGLPMSKLEADGILIPTLEVHCKYVMPVTVGDVIVIKPAITLYNGVRLNVGYDVREERSNKMVIEADTKHCFTDKNIRPVGLSHCNEEYHKIFLSLSK